MERVKKMMEKDQKFNHLPIMRRLVYFAWRRKISFVVTFAIYGGYQFWGSPVGIASSWVERSYKRYKKAYILKNSPQCISIGTAMDTLY